MKYQKILNGLLLMKDIAEVFSISLGYRTAEEPFQQNLPGCRQWFCLRKVVLKVNS